MRDCQRSVAVSTGRFGRIEAGCGSSRHSRMWANCPKEKAMKKMIDYRISLLLIASVFALAPVAGAQSKASSKDVTITGTVTCAKYAFSKPDRKGFTPAEAIRM